MKNVESTMDALKEAAVQINTMSEEERNKFILNKKQFSTLRLTWIQYVYGDHGEEMIKHMNRNPAKAIPIILDRMQKRWENWNDAKQDLVRNWKDICERNFIKSLDHRSFSFKNNEKKNMNQKYYTTEIKGRLQSKLRDSLNVQLGGVEDWEYFTTFAEIGNPMKHSLEASVDKEDSILLNLGFEK
jgi:paired amphipathic helix protein Sin3a